jgi:hypothetical protein
MVGVREGLEADWVAEAIPKHAPWVLLVPVALELPLDQEASVAVLVEALGHLEAVGSVPASATEAVFVVEAAVLAPEVGLVTNLTVMGQVLLQMVHRQVPVDLEGKADTEAVLEGLMIEMAAAQLTTNRVEVAAIVSRLVQDKVGAAIETETVIAIAIETAKVGIAEMTRESDHTTEMPTTSRDTKDDTSKQNPGWNIGMALPRFDFAEVSNSRAIDAPIRLTNSPAMPSSSTVRI